MEFSYLEDKWIFEVNESSGTVKFFNNEMTIDFLSPDELEDLGELMITVAKAARRRVSEPVTIPMRPLVKAFLDKPEEEG